MARPVSIPDYRKCLKSTVAAMAMFCVALFFGAGSCFAQDRIVGSFEFKWHCSPCHGSDGKGKVVSQALQMDRAPDLTTLAIRNSGTYPEELVKNVIAGSTERKWHERSSMPPWGLYYSLEEVVGSSTGLEEWRDEYVAEMIQAVSDYVRSLQVDE